ncbi:invasion associated locus B family protein [Blastomonas sp.]|uniref:invasion associated locus B family protein n=1 Tax=Blastomonas sp. TaxID=1909299 RepID=UPI002635C18D|nr:invasion associated locus B family protein [Blastomonas sp.]MDM7955960.1 invasion associated locus B family protein [Blastomonas sp.]
MLRTLICLAPVALMGAPLAAQQAPQQAAPAAAQKVADGAKPWTTGCKGAGEAEICDTVQSLIDEANGKEVIRVAIAKQKSTGKTGLLVKVPLGVRLDTGALIQIDGDKAKGIDQIVFSRCLPEGCIAEKPLAVADMDHLKKAQKLELVFLDLEGKPIVINVVATGLGAALATF